MSVTMDDSIKRWTAKRKNGILNNELYLGHITYNR
jgi:hypothetical protein